MDAFSDTVAQVVSDWLRAVYRRESREIDRDLDQAVWESFPASDPIAPFHAKEGDERVHELRVVVHCDRLELIRVERAGEPLAAEGGVTRRIEGATPEGETVRIEIAVDEKAAKSLPMPPGSRLAEIVAAAAPGSAGDTGRRSFLDDMPKSPPEHA